VATAHLHAENGVTGEMLLGALVDAGASIEAVDDAVATLGVGAVRLAWARVERGGRPCCTVRLRAPEETPPVDTWQQVRHVLTFAALPDAVRDCAVGIFERLVQAEAAAAGLDPDDLALPPVGALDVMALVVGVCTAVHELGIDTLTVGPVGVGAGRATTTTGEHDLPTPAVAALLQDFETRTRDTAGHQLTTATGAAILAELARPAPSPPAAPAARIGLGAGDRDAPNAPVLQVDLVG
jgi:uncharacterized protein (DUF111 family)